MECIGVPPSAIAAAALKTSVKMFGKKWDRTLAHYSDYTNDELDAVGSRLIYVSFPAIFNTALNVYSVGTKGVHI